MYFLILPCRHGVGGGGSTVRCVALVFVWVRTVGLGTLFLINMQGKGAEAQRAGGGREQGGRKRCNFPLIPAMADSLAFSLDSLINNSQYDVIKQFSHNSNSFLYSFFIIFLLVFQ